VTVQCLFGGWGQSIGSVAYDDLRFEEIDLSTIKPSVTIRMDQTRAPIDPFIYGQFIEHLGRCIYGGIWAEMLEDRKFYFPIEADYNPYRNAPEDKNQQFPIVARSPWQIIGRSDGVSMVAKGAFVGRNTPLVQPGVAIQQNDLALVKGKQYIGHVWLRSPGSAKVAVTLSAAAGEGSFVGLEDAYRMYEFSFTATESTDKASFKVAVAGAPAFVGAVSLMPADNTRGMRPDTLELLKRLDSPIYRWPGGNFVSGYDWRDGIGDRDRRPPRRNPAWTGVEHNDFGIDEYIDFCRTIGTEPLIAVNTGFGDSYSAAQEVEYCNGGPQTVGGGWRVANGHAEPYTVKYWCVGNEMFGNWQLGYMALGQYEIKHNEVAEKMRAVDPGIVLVGVGAVGDWSRGMLGNCAASMNMISEHFYCAAMDDVVNHVQQIPSSIRRIVSAHRAYRKEIPGLADRDIRIAMDEWNYWYDHHNYVYGELGNRYRARDALGIAAGLHEFFRNSDIIRMANYAQSVNVIGCIKTTKTDAFLATTALPLILYRKHFGTIPVEVSGNTEILAIDVMAAWTEKRDAVTIGVVNPNSKPMTLAVDVQGAKPSREGTRWEIAASDPDVFNDAEHTAVKIESSQCEFDGRLTVPAYSVTLVRLEAK
ncbi:MAG: alpha-N-arabinofuranosidase, partial [Planctomycetes bacterium]|nr:alpha-N-arabinofuranosidase [Planctomycetota bacterium]